MYHLTSIRRVALGAALAGAALGAVPAMASAAPQCFYDTPTKTVTVFDDDSTTPMAIRRTGFGRLFAGAGVFCRSSSGVQATVNNTDLIRMLPVTDAGTGDGVVIDESQGPLAPGFSPEADGSPEIEISVGNVLARPTLRVIGTSQADHLTVGGSGAALDLDADTDTDVTVNDVPASVQLEGRRGNDVLAGAGFGVQPATHLSLTLLGGEGNDAIFGGLGADVISGDAGADDLRAVDGIADTTVSGGADNDHADVDKVDHVDTVETKVVH